jgi:hypothetical protein
MDGATINRLESFAVDAKRGGSMADDEIADAIRSLIDHYLRLAMERNVLAARAERAELDRDALLAFGVYRHNDGWRIKGERVKPDPFMDPEKAKAKLLRVALDEYAAQLYPEPQA